MGASTAVRDGKDNTASTADVTTAGVTTHNVTASTVTVHDVTTSVTTEVSTHNVTTVTSPATSSPTSPSTTSAPNGSGRKFDVASFFGGMATALGVAIIIFVIVRCYTHSQKTRYHAM